MFRQIIRHCASGIAIVLLAACLPDSKNDHSTTTTTSTGTPVSGVGGNANSVSAAMYSQDSRLTHRAPIDESQLESVPLYFFLEPSKDWTERGVSRVVYKCCKGIGGLSLGSPHSQQVTVASEPWTTLIDLTGLQSQSTNEVELEVSFSDGGPRETLRAQFYLKDDPTAAPNPTGSNPGSNSGNGNNPAPQNNPPQISGNPSADAIVGSEYRFEPTATDSDGDTIAFSIANRPRWADFDSLTGILSGTPGPNDVGVYPNVTLLVSDGQTTSNLAPFTIEVSAGGTGSVALSWVPPTQRTDGTALSNLAGYRLRFGQQPGSYGSEVDIPTPGLTSYVVDNLSSGRWYFAITAYDTSGLESELSQEASKIVP